MSGVDLHTHTTASDGDQTPDSLVRHAALAGLQAISVTDHDTTAGLTEALAAGSRYGVEVVPGIEISAVAEKGQCHLLGYYIDAADPRLEGRLSELRDARQERNCALVDRLNSLGIDLTLQEVSQEAKGDLIARPHFARVMVRKGAVSNFQEAFDKYLADGLLPGISKEKLLPEEAITLIHEAGGAASLAHPNNLKRDQEATEMEINRLKSLGLDGIEALYSSHTAEENARYLALAQRLGLLVTGGSDFHGYSVKPLVQLGHVDGGCPAPYSMLANIKSFLNSTH